MKKRLTGLDFFFFALGLAGVLVLPPLFRWLCLGGRPPFSDGLISNTFFFRNMGKEKPDTTASGLLLTDYRRFPINDLQLQKVTSSNFMN
ncbi:hypothetical protein [Paenibacillus pinistramenti]|uniref:hypothetical protein n=1 Tax=Paenibacillus pinistramenti TaxID=1768003 RepID=UPI00308430FC